MTVERALRLTAGLVILASLALAHYHSHYWLWLTAFVGFNLMQSAFTNWCPAMTLFRILGLPEEGGCCGGCGGGCDCEDEECGCEDEKETGEKPHSCGCHK